MIPSKSNIKDIELKLSNWHKLRKYNIETIEQISKIFAEDLNQKWRTEYSKVDIYKFEKMGKSFAASIIMNVFEEDWELFHKRFLEEHGLKFVPINRRFLDQKIKEVFDQFLLYLRDNQIKKRHPTILEKYDMSFYNVVIQDKYNNDRNLFFKSFDYNKKKIWFSIKKVPKITDKIRFQRTKSFIKRMKEREVTYFSPITIGRYSNALELDFIRHFRTSDNKVDWLFILFKFFKDIDIISRFRHNTDDSFKSRLKYDSINDSIDKHLYRLSEDLPNPEQELIDKEERTILQHAILQLSAEEQSIIKNFYDEKQINMQQLESIIEKLQNIIKPEK
jgi:hypothetical protein